MLNESTERAQARIEGEYEPPALVVLGSVADLTASVADGSVIDSGGGGSDRALKRDIEPLERPLERLRAIRTR